MVFQAGVAVAVLVVIGVFVSRLIVTEFHKPSEQLPDLGERRAQYQRLIALYPTTPGEESKAAIRTSPNPNALTADAFIGGGVTSNVWDE